MRSFNRVLTVVSLVLVVAILAFAQTKDKPKAGMPSKEDQQKMMADMMKMMQPGPQHEVLAKMAGDWTMTGKIWMDPNSPGEEMKPGTQHSEMILGGRYLSSVNQGEMMGMPFEGHGMMGYDNFKKQYQMTWIDNMGTTISTASGTADATGKVITLMGKMDDPSTGKKDLDVKYVYTLKDDKTVGFAMFEPKDGKDVKVMDMTYAKK